MKYTIKNSKTIINWDARQMTGTVEATVQIDGMEQKMPAEAGKGLYLTSLDAYTEPVLTACIIDRDGREMDRIFPLPLEEEIQFCMQVEEPQLWNAEDPYCYQLVLEVMEGEHLSLDRRVEPVAFCDWKITNGYTCINDKIVTFRAAAFPEGTKDPERQRRFLAKMKRSWKNTLLVTPEERTEQLEKLCLEYGIYLLEDGKDADAGALRARLELEQESDTNPDFQLQVVQTGVMIENRSTFINVSDYHLHYEITDASGRKCSENELCTDVPAGTSKYVDIPFERPSEPGEYLYRVVLCLKEDTPWAPKGYAVASAETKISNLYERPEIS